MAYTVEDVIARARNLVQDKEPEYRYDDDLYIAYLNDALNETRRMRPDLYISTDGVVTPLDISNLDDLFPLDDQYFSVLVSYVASMISLEDDKFMPEGKGMQLMAIFHSKLVGKL